MLTAITYYQIFGKPLIMYLGILTLLGFMLTAAVAVLNRKGYHQIPMSWHIRLAKISIALALLHGLLGILSYF